MIYLIWDLSLEAYVGAVISLFIIKAGIGMMIETTDDILGKRTDKEESDRIKGLICEFPEVQGAYDLILFNYGPDRNYGSVHIELPDTMTVEQVDKLTRRIQIKVYTETGIILTGVGVYSHNTTDPETASMREKIKEKLKDYDWALQMHGFYADKENKTMRFDVVISFDIESAEAVRILTEDVKALCPDYTALIVPDIDA